MAHMLPVTVPDCFQRKRVASVSAALGSGMEILVHLERQVKEMEAFKSMRKTGEEGCIKKE